MSYEFKISTDCKKRGSCGRKRKPPMNRFAQAKKSKETESDRVDCVQTDSVDKVSVESGIPAKTAIEKRRSENATPTPTRSEMKLHDIYKSSDEP